jgi:hypothetical protein
MKIKHHILALCLIVVALLFTGCGSSTRSTTDESTTDTTSDINSPYWMLDSYNNYKNL